MAGPKTRFGEAFSLARTELLDFDTLPRGFRGAAASTSPLHCTDWEWGVVSEIHTK